MPFDSSSGDSYFGTFGEFCTGVDNRVVVETLGGFLGTLVTDGYAAYDRFSEMVAGLIHALCWTHVRRKFAEAKGSEPELCGRVLDQIGTLYEHGADIGHVLDACNLGWESTIVTGDPLFCDPAGGDFTVREGSLALAGPLLFGAYLTPGCTAPTPVELTIWGAIKSQYPTPTSP